MPVVALDQVKVVVEHGRMMLMAVERPTTAPTPRLRLSTRVAVVVAASLGQWHRSLVVMALRVFASSDTRWPHNG